MDYHAYSHPMYFLDCKMNDVPQKCDFWNTSWCFCVLVTVGGHSGRRGTALLWASKQPGFLEHLPSLTTNSEWIYFPFGMKCKRIPPDVLCQPWWGPVGRQRMPVLHKGMGIGGHEAPALPACALGQGPRQMTLRNFGCCKVLVMGQK